MKKGFLIVMEGSSDGIGKTTQYNLLKESLINLGYDVVSHHFPTYKSLQGSLVEAYLNGSFGSISELSPYFINSLYAIDRACTWNMVLKSAYDSGKIILLDRYTTSSILYQSSVISDLDERKKFVNYIEDYEYQKLGIPRPDMVLFLTAPFDLITKLREDRKENEGESNDLHERNISFLKGVYDNSVYISKYLNWDIIECSNNNKIKSIETIHNDIMSHVLKKIK